MDSYYSFAFRGLLSEEALDKAGRSRRAHGEGFLDEKTLARLSIPLLDEKFLAPAKQMAVVFIAISAFENSVRDFIKTKLLEQNGEDWWTKGVSEKIRLKAESRKLEEEKIKWHTQRGEHPINFTDFGELSSILHQNWLHFEPHLQNHDWAAGIFRTLERSRNVIMHSGTLERGDLERIGLCIRDWTKQVGI